jgi:hypothetical protein
MTKFYIGGQYAVGQLAYLKKNGTANDTFIEAETLEEALEVFKAYAKTKDNPFDPGAKLIGMICTWQDENNKLQFKHVQNEDADGP